MKASLCLLEILNMVNKTADSINCGYTRTYLTPIIQKSKGKKPKMPGTFIITLHKVSDFNHITFREFYTLYLGFQQKSGGVLENSSAITSLRSFFWSTLAETFSHLGLKQLSGSCPMSLIKPHGG